jgi:hypothetical protein
LDFAAKAAGSFFEKNLMSLPDITNQIGKYS